MAIDAIELFVQSFGHMRQRAVELREYIVEGDQSAAAWIPGVSLEGDRTGAEARQAAARHCGAFWYWDEIQERSGGLIAASPATIAALNALNQAKLDFKARVLALRVDSSRHRLETLIRNAATGAERNEQVARA
ncbi:conserved hypothetical protein, partial [Ricinus communis]